MIHPPHFASRFVILLVLGFQTSHASADGRIRQMTTLATLRAVHTTTALSPTQLLVAGGMDSSGSLATAELIDVSKARVSPLPSMLDARAGHTATRLPNGRVVVAGGYNGTYLRSVEVFDPKTRRFTFMGQLKEGRSGHTATLLSDGQILIVGGVGTGWSFLSTAELFDPSTGQSQAVGPLGVARESHTATLLADGRVLITGGHRGRHEAMEVYATAELYEPATRRFQAVGSLVTARHKHDAVRLADGRVLVLGGADRTDRHYYATTEIYNPVTASFTPGPSMASTRYKFQGTSVQLDNGDVLVATGARVAEILDHRSFTFRSVPGVFPTALYFATATLLSGDDVVIVGGYGPRIQNTAGVWRFHQF